MRIVTGLDEEAPKRTKSQLALSPFDDAEITAITSCRSKVAAPVDTIATRRKKDLCR